MLRVRLRMCTKGIDERFWEFWIWFSANAHRRVVAKIFVNTQIVNNGQINQNFPTTFFKTENYFRRPHKFQNIFVSLPPLSFYQSLVEEWSCISPASQRCFRGEQPWANPQLSEFDLLVVVFVVLVVFALWINEGVFYLAANRILLRCVFLFGRGCFICSEYCIWEGLYLPASPRLFFSSPRGRFPRRSLCAEKRDVGWVPSQTCLSRVFFSPAGMVLSPLPPHAEWGRGKSTTSAEKNNTLDRQVRFRTHPMSLFPAHRDRRGRCGKKSLGLAGR